MEKDIVDATILPAEEILKEIDGFWSETTPLFGKEIPMRTVNEVSKLTGVSIRTLQYYDSIGLLKPTEYTEVGYRLYDEEALERLQQILLF